MKLKHKDKLKILQAELDQLRGDHHALKRRHETLTNSVTRMIQDQNHLREALSQNGLWDGTNSPAFKQKTVQ